MKSTGGFRSRTRYKLAKKKRNRGKVNINKLLQVFKIGEKVRIVQEPAVHKGMPHPRLKNNVGIIKKKQGKAYIVETKELSKEKKVIANAIHLRRL